ncbi:hypothetical protein [Nonomuraea dietziae]|uniref:hypothetical protein n=1 Tax=Nonomuraea dietziae TaxID=65515 RepID=UPI0033C1600E
MDATSRAQAVISLMENIDTLAPITPQVMLAARRCIDDLQDTETAARISDSVRDLIEGDHYLAKNDLNLAYMIRVLAGSHSRENERTLIRLYGSTHGYGGQSAPNIQRDILLALAKWGARYWLSSRKSSFGTDHVWVRRAFRIAHYALGDEGKHWREANRPEADTIDSIVQKWAADRSSNPRWVIPV